MSFKETEIGRIPTNWEIGSVGQSLYIKGRIGWKGLKKSEYLNESAYRIINGSALDGKNIAWDKCGYISEERYEESPEIMLQKNDIVMTKDGTIGKIAIINELEMKTTVASGLFVIRVITSEISYKYLYYYFSSRYFKELVKSRIEGSVIPHLYQRDLVELKMPMPKIDEQKAIAKILSDLDEKIEINNKINKNLEEMAQAIFKRWFVDFEFPNQEGKPYKTSGGEMVESELGLIPKGWYIANIGEVSNLIIDYRGKTPKKLGMDWSETGIIALSAKTVKNNSLINLEQANKVSEELYEVWMKEKLKCGDILMTSEAPMGEFYYLANFSKYCLSQRLYAIRANSEIIKSSILYNTMISSSVKGEILNRGTGTTVIGIRQTELKKVRVIVPKMKIQNKINNFFDNILLKKEYLMDENKKLEKIRDTLLPKLMSGEIRVPLNNIEQ